jgi:hypothetical protein
MSGAKASDTRASVRVILARVRFPSGVCAALALAFLVACSGGGEPKDTFAVSTTGRPTSASTARETVAAGKLKLPSAARLFAGTASAAGQLTHYCKNEKCTDQSARVPAFVTAPAGAFVLFTIGESPVHAVADVFTRTGEEAGNVQLTPGTLMVFNHSLGKGRWLVDLVVRWKASEARWRFGLTVS